MNLYGLNLYGLELHTSLGCIDLKTVRVKTHRQKRIDKKWLKRYGFRQISVPSQKTFVMGNKIICHPATAKKLLILMAKERETL
jgi:hypothetical protein